MASKAKSKAAPLNDVVQPLRFFVQLKGHGLADANGKTALGIGMSGARTIATPDAPLALVVAILEEWHHAWKYSSIEAAKKDVARLQDFVNNLTVE
jgi:hypothetical protein